MLHFNNLKYYTIPTLPESWSAPGWLRTELGFFAGRLYFEWSEYNTICDLLGIDASAPMLNESDTSEGDTSDELATEASNETAITIPTTDDRIDGKGKEIHSSSRPRPQRTGLSPKPFTFTQDYLSVRRRGQEISHTPMGFLCMGKPLHENHAFFRLEESTRPKKGLASVAMAQVDGGDAERVGDDMEVGEYDPSAALVGDEEHEEIEYDEAELYHEEDEDPVHGSKVGKDDKPPEQGRHRGGRR